MATRNDRLQCTWMTSFSSVHICFAFRLLRRGNMKLHALLGHPVSENFVSWCQTLKNSSASFSDFPKLAEKLSVIRTDRHENLVRPKNILPVRKKSPKKFTVTCIMFSLAFLEWFTLVLAIGHLISPLIFIEVKVIQFSVFSVVQYCICYVFYSVCLEFYCFYDLVL